MKFIDLFAGTGGMRLGLEQALSKLSLRSKCVFSSEIDEKACDTYELNFGERPSGDIRETLFGISSFDFLLAGFPCQSFSYAGKKKGFGDTRGTLFFEVEKILSRHRPKGFLLENVRGLTTHDQGRTFETIIHSLRNLGYKTTSILANSSMYGVPQNRVRIFILGLHEQEVKTSIFSHVGATDSHAFKNKNRNLDLFHKEYPHRIVRDILEPRVDKKFICTDKFTRMLAKATGGDFEKLHGIRLIDFRGGNSLHSWELGVKGECSSAEIEFMNMLISNRRKKVFGTHQDGKMLTLEQIKTFYHKKNMSTIISGLLGKGYLKKQDDRYNPVCGNMSFEVFKFLDPESISITLTSSDAHRLGVVQNGIPRRITPKECARLQGFPENFVLHPNDNASYKQMGNAVSVPVVRNILEDMFTMNELTDFGYESEKIFEHA